jgi:hypothetical protein
VLAVHPDDKRMWPGGLLVNEHMRSRHSELWYKDEMKLYFSHTLALHTR